MKQNTNGFAGIALIVGLSFLSAPSHATSRNSQQAPSESKASKRTFHTLTQEGKHEEAADHLRQKHLDLYKELSKRADSERRRGVSPAESIRDPEGIRLEEKRVRQFEKQKYADEMERGNFKNAQKIAREHQQEIGIAATQETKQEKREALLKQQQKWFERENLSYQALNPAKSKSQESPSKWKRVIDKMKGNKKVHIELLPSEVGTGK